MKEKTRTIIHHLKEIYPECDTRKLEADINSVFALDTEQLLEDIYKLEVAGLKRK